MASESGLALPYEAERQPMPVFTLAEEDAGETIDPPWVDWLVRLTTRFTLWDESGSVQQFARAIERIEQLRGTESRKAPSEYVGPDPTVRVPRTNPRKLDRAAAGFSPPADFDRYDFTPDYARNLMQGMLDMGHRIGYHSMNHQTRWFRHLQAYTPAQIRDDIELFETVMSLTLEEAWIPEWARLPGGMGRKFRHVRQGLHLGGLRASVEWDMEEEAWGPATSNSNLRRLAARLVKSKEDTVILLHEYAGLDRQLAVFVGAVHDAVQSQANVGDQRGEAGEGAP